MKYHKLTIIYFFLMMALVVTPNTAVAKKKRILSSYDHYRYILVGDFDAIVSSYRFIKKYDTGFYGQIIWKLSNIVLLNPKVVFPDEIVEILQYIAIKISNLKESSLGPVYGKFVTAVALSYYYLVKKEYKRAIKKLKKANYWLSQYSLKSSGLYSIHSSGGRSDYLRNLIRIKKIEAILGRKSKKVKVKDFNKIICDESIIDTDYVLREYLSMLIIYKDSETFKELVLFDYNRGVDYSELFWCKEVAGFYFQWFKMHRYWLDKKFFRLIGDLEKQIVTKLPRCKFPNDKRNRIILNQ